MIQVNEKEQQETIHLLLGGSGFIGNELIKYLKNNKQKILCIDDDTSGNFVNTNKRFRDYSKIKFHLGDINEQTTIDWITKEIGEGAATIWHLAANSDIKTGSTSPNLDAQKTFMTSIAVCNLIDTIKIKYVNFASTSAVYGELSNEETFTENSPCNPISYYGHAKQASEKFLEIKAKSRDIPLLIFRFANIVGTPATHGVIFDLIHKVKDNHRHLEVLGNGSQTKSYLHVENLIEMMSSLWMNGETGIFNLGAGDLGITVREIAECLVMHLPTPIPIRFGESPRGWEGDAVKVLMDTSKLESKFTSAKTTSSEAIHRAVHEIAFQLELTITCPNSQEFNWLIGE
jgi:UDP-glucose 4-epimerase